MSEALRVGIGLDVGEKRIGVARGDLAVKLASPLAPIMNDQTNAPLLQIWQLMRDSDADFIVVGLPRNAHGEETEQSEMVRQFVARLQTVFQREQLSVELFFQDESLTSVRAEEFLRGRKNFQERMLRDGTLDSEAATIILGDFLNSGQVVPLSIVKPTSAGGEHE